MEIPKELFKKWKVLRSPGDSAKIVKLLKNAVVYETIRRVWVEECCSDEVFKVMAEFYEKKAEMIKQYL